MKKKIIRVTTVPASLGGLLQGQLKFMSNHYEVIGISSKGKNNQLLDVSKKEGVHVVPIEMTRTITPLKDILALWELYKVFRKKKPFIVHSHTPKAGTLSMIAARFAGVPHRLHTIAGLPLLEATGFKRNVLNMVEKTTYACATKIYPNSHGLTTIILENNFTQNEKIKVIANGSSNGIDTEFFNPVLFDSKFNNGLREKLNITKEDFVFVFAGRLVGDKGINELVKSFDTLNKELKNIKLLLVGSYENELDPLLLTTQHSIENNSNIIATGWVDDVRPYFSISNVLAFPSYREGFPNTVMQAAAMQLPCIVTNINGCNEIIKHQETGLIIPTKDHKALYEAMLQMTNKSMKTKQMGVTSRKLMISKFERKEVWHALLNEYKQLY